MSRFFISDLSCPDMGCGSGASSELVQGVLLTLQQLFSNMADIKLPLDMLKQVGFELLNTMI